MNFKNESTQKIIYFFAFYVVITVIYVLSETTALSMFVNRFGISYLPYFFGLAPIGLILGMFFYSMVANRVDRLRIFYGLFGISLLFFVFSAFWGINNGWFSVVLLFYVEVIALFMPIQFFIILNDIFDVKESQRAVPLVSAGWFVGTGLAGTTAQSLAKLIHTQNLLLIVVAFFAAGILLVYAIDRKYRNKLRKSKKVKAEELSGRYALAYLNGSFLFQLLFFSTFLLYSVYFSLNYQFLYAGHARFPLEDDFTAYCGILLLVFSVLGLMIQVLITPRFLGKFGINRGILLLPAGIMSGGILLIAFPSIASSFIAWLIAMTVKETIYMSSFQIYFNQISRHLRSGVRNIVQGISTPAGGIMAAVFIFITGLFWKGSDFIPHLAWVILIIAILWFILALIIRKGYERMLYTNAAVTDFELRLNVIQALEDPNNTAVLDRIIKEIKNMERDIKERVNLETILIQAKGGEAMVPKSEAEYLVSKIIHGTENTQRFPKIVVAGHDVVLAVATYPKAKGRAFLWVNLDLTRLDGTKETKKVSGNWTHNEKGSSYWAVGLGYFQDGDQVDYVISLQGERGDIINSEKYSFRVGPYLYLNLMLLLSTPSLKDMKENIFLGDLVRVQTIYYYYDILSNLHRFFKNVRMTVNVAPVMLEQLAGYIKGETKDPNLMMARKPVEKWDDNDKSYILKSFFRVDSVGQVDAIPRYRELWDKRDRAEEFSHQDLLDLIACYNLSWLTSFFEAEEVPLETGEIIRVSRFLKKGRDFNQPEIEEIIGEQVKVIDGFLKMLKQMAEEGQIEFAVSPYYSPNLPLIYNSDWAFLKELPTRFAYPQDATAQIEKAISFFRGVMGTDPRGMWPPDAAISPEIINLFSEKGLGWIVSDASVLAKSDTGYDDDNPNVIARAYKLKTRKELACFFSEEFLLEDFIDIYGQYLDKYKAADDFLSRIKYLYAYKIEERENAILTIVIDSMYALRILKHNMKEVFFAILDNLNKDKEVKTITPCEFILGNKSRGIAAHPVSSLKGIDRLATGSWYGKEVKGESDLSSWIGSVETNYAWELLRAAREALEKSGATPSTHPQAYEAIYQAECSSWFLWYDDPDRNIYLEDFDRTFRNLLKQVYLELKQPPPVDLDVKIVPDEPYWDPDHVIEYMEGNKTLTIQTSRPGSIKWGMNGWDQEKEEKLVSLPVPAEFKADIYRFKIEVFDDRINEINFTFVWEDGTEDENEYRILVDWAFEQILRKMATREGRFF